MIKKITNIMLAFSIIISATQCYQDNDVNKQQSRQQDVNFSFKVDGVTRLVKANFQFDKSLKTFALTSASNDMNVKVVKDSKTKKMMYVYTLKPDNTCSKNARDRWEVKVGYYGYTADGCFIWGTLYVDAEGDEIFVTGNQSNNPPICPGGLWAYSVIPEPKPTENIE